MEALDEAETVRRSLSLSRSPDLRAPCDALTDCARLASLRASSQADVLSKPLSQDEWRAVFRAIAEREGGGAAASSIWLQTSAFTHADVGRYVSIAGERVKVWTGAEDADGKVRQVRWEFAHANVDGRIVSVDERIGGRVLLEDGSHFLNPELEDVSVALRQHLAPTIC